MSKVKFIVLDKNTLELREEAKSGDIIDLTDEMAIDTTTIEAKVAQEIAQAKDRAYASKLEAEKKALLAEEEKKRIEALAELNKKIELLEAQGKSQAELNKQALANKDKEMAEALENKAKLLQSSYDNKVLELTKAIEAKDAEKKIAIQEAIFKNQEAIKELEMKILAHNQEMRIKEQEALMDKQAALAKKDTEIQALTQSIREEKKSKEDALRGQKESFDKQLEMKDQLIDQYKNFKLQLSTKNVGESLEQYCYNEFNKVRYAFPKVYFEKDNAVVDGTKGDFVYREVDESGVEILSIMFEMKNEMDTTATKHKNEDFFAKLDSDRTKKNCEYAVLVTMLEADNEYYNTGIVSVYSYEKMYVVRPHLFMTLIGILRQAALNAHQYKVELKAAKDANIDITNFEGKLDKFKSDFLGHYDSATKNHDAAIAEIDKAIKNLEAVKASLQKSNKYLDYCNKDMEKMTIKKLTYGNPTMKKLFDEASTNDEEE